jgi:hypothetical protein
VSESGVDVSAYLAVERCARLRTSPIEIRRQLEKFSYLEDLGAGAIDLNEQRRRTSGRLVASSAAGAFASGRRPNVAGH